MTKVLKSKILKLATEGMSFIEISRQLRCAKSTVSYHCSKFVTKEDNFTKEKINIYQAYYNEGHSFKNTAKKFGVSRQRLGKELIARKLTSLQIKQKAKSRCDSYRVRVKKECVEYKGNKCAICGYNKCQAAMDFHHINPQEKDFQISGGTKSFESLKSELDKCILVCRNCHSEIHAGLHTDIFPRTDTALKG